MQNTGLDDGSLWWDLLLGLDLDNGQVCRLPLFLQALDGRSEHVEPSQLEMVDRWLSRHGWAAEAALGPGCVIPEWKLESAISVSVIIPTRHNRTLIEGALKLIRAAEWTDFDLIIVDNGVRNAENESWYATHAVDLDPTIIWWDAPFNYSAVNNYAATQASGEVLVFLNDDTALGHSGWLANLCGWVQRPEIGVAGLQLIDNEGLIQHSGVVLGIHGFASNLFWGMLPQSASLLGSTDWTRNAVAVTGACLAVRRSVFEEIGGFDERLKMVYSDVVLGLRAHEAGYRNVMSAATPVRHLESATRGWGNDPPSDVFRAYWFFRRWLMGGDPYWSPSLSADHHEPRLRSSDEPTILERLSQRLERPMEMYQQHDDSSKAHSWPLVSEPDHDLRESVTTARTRRIVKSVNWFVPELQHPFDGSTHTVMQIADYLASHHQAQNRFIVMARPGVHNELWYRSGIAIAFPSLADSLVVYDDPSSFDPDLVPPADVAIATKWTAAYFVARTPGQNRRFYLIQDYEHMFQPVGSPHAIAEDSYRLGLYGLCNTEHLADIYRDRYGAVADYFWPAVDGRLFHDSGGREPDPDRPTTVFFHGDPGDPGNCWELAAQAMSEVKRQLAEEVRIVTTGPWTPPDNAYLTHLGQPDYRETGTLYRSCDIGVAPTVSEHCSRLPLELMACGAAVVAFDNSTGGWLFRNDHNCVRAPQTSAGLATGIIALAADPTRQRRLAKQGRADIIARHASWEHNLARVYDYLCDPELRR